MGDVLAAPRPDVAPGLAEEVAERAFGVGGDATALPGERDCNFRLDTIERSLCLKVAHPLEDAAVVEMQALALEHLARVDPGLAVPRVQRTAEGERVPRVEIGGVEHAVLLVTFLDGVAPRPGGDSRAAIGATLARLDRALRGFFHPLLGRALLWDISRLGELRPHVRHAAAERRDLLEAWLGRFERELAPRLAAMRGQAIHGDLNPANVLVDPARPGTATGIVDFGDMVHAPLVLDLAIAAAYQCFGEEDVELPLAELAQAYESANPLEPEELRLLPDLVACRLVQSVVVGAWRATLDPDNAEYVLADQEDSWETLLRFEALRDRPAPGLASSIARRRAVLGPALSLSYDEPIQPVRGDGVWLWDADGTRYLDAYNNVPQVGHSRPEVVEAIARQLRVLTTNTRYLVGGVVEYAERLAGLMPDPLDVVMFVNSGSEANDLAYQIATVVTGNRGAIFTEHAYHGCTWVTTAMSPEEFGLQRIEEWGEPIAPPRRLRDLLPAADRIDAAVERLAARGHAPAMVITDSIFASDGIFPLPPGYLRETYARVRAAGGLCVADEVQAGFARVGRPFWGFALDGGSVPDVVTLGKPMGNGHPMGAVVTTRAIADEFARNWHFFSTFAGSPVAAAAGSAVLDVIDRDGLAAHVETVGDRLRARIAGLGHPAVVEVRGAGLFVGVELATPDAARDVVEAMRRRHVLIGRTGKEKNVLKIRPPLVFDDSHADLLLEALAVALAGS